MFSIKLFECKMSSRKDGLIQAKWMEGIQLDRPVLPFRYRDPPEMTPVHYMGACVYIDSCTIKCIT